MPGHCRNSEYFQGAAVSKYTVHPKLWTIFLAPIAFAALAFGSQAAIAWAASELWSSSTQQRIFPGSSDVELKEPGPVSVYYEYESTIGDRQFHTPENPAPLTIDIGGWSGANVVVLPESGDPVIVAEMKFRKIASFTVTAPGQYRFSAGYKTGIQSPKFVLSLGGEVPLFLWIAGFCYTVVPIVFAVCAVAAPFILWQRRKISRKRLKFHLEKRAEPLI